MITKLMYSELLLFCILITIFSGKHIKSIIFLATTNLILCFSLFILQLTIEARGVKI
jgi:hypothetical protein